jgi:hypothetical protein
VLLACWVGGCASAGDVPAGVPASAIAAGSCETGQRLAAGMNTTCAVLGPKRQLSCWGADFDGSLSFGTQRTFDACDSTVQPAGRPHRSIACSKRPLALELDDVRTAALGVVNCAVRRDDSVHCWGFEHEFAADHAGFFERAWSDDLPAAHGVLQLTASRFGVYGLREDATVQRLTMPDSRHANPFSALRGVRQIVAGILSVCAVTVDERVYCVGDRIRSPGCPDDSDCTRQAFEIPGLRALEIAVAGERICARTRDGRVLCWGSYGHIDKVTPGMQEWRPVPGLPRVSRLAGGAGHACALAADGGALYCWGPRTTADRHLEKEQASTPEPAAERIEGLPQVCELAGGLFHMCAVGVDAAVYCWGGNHYGQLGDGSTRDRPTQAVRILPPGSVSR